MSARPDGLLIGFVSRQSLRVQYLYRLGDGNDVIVEATSGIDVDTLTFVDLNPTDVKVRTA